MYGPRGDDVLVVRRRGSLVELLRVLLRDRRGDRHHEERGEARRPAPCVSLNVILYGSSRRRMPGMSLSAPGFFGQPSMKLKYVVYWFGTFFGERALERVLDVLRLDLAVDRRAELDALLELHRDGLLVVGDLAARPRRGRARPRPRPAWARRAASGWRRRPGSRPCSTSGPGRGSRRRRRRAARACRPSCPRWVSRCLSCRRCRCHSRRRRHRRRRRAVRATSARAATSRSGDLIMQRSFPGLFP